LPPPNVGEFDIVSVGVNTINTTNPTASKVKFALYNSAGTTYSDTQTTYNGYIYTAITAGTPTANFLAQPVEVRFPVSLTAGTNIADFNSLIATPKGSSKALSGINTASFSAQGVTLQVSSIIAPNTQQIDFVVNPLTLSIDSVITEDVVTADFSSLSSTVTPLPE